LDFEIKNAKKSAILGKIYVSFDQYNMAKCGENVKLLVVLTTATFYLKSSLKRDLANHEQLFALRIFGSQS
jgi:hypothetical protein